MTKETEGEGRKPFFINALPPPWRMLTWVGLGVFCGLALVVADVSRAVSYLFDDPETCVNCHVMGAQYSTWQHSSHAQVAHCNDCHVPHDNVVNHYFFKAMDGVKHASVFSMRLEPQVIELSEGAKPVVMDNCRRCHDHQLTNLTAMGGPAENRLCWDCHTNVPHGEVRSLSATPTQMRPQLPESGKNLDNLTIGNRETRPKEEQ